jgi:hypothetical protein
METPKVKGSHGWGRGIQARTGASQALANGLGLGAMALATGSLGNLSDSLNGILAIGALLALAFVFDNRLGELSLVRLVVALVLMVAALPVVACSEPVGLLGTALFFFSLSLVVSEKGTRVLSPLLLTALAFGLYRLIVGYAAAAWHIEHSLASRFSWLVGAGLRLGPTALGLPLFILFACHALSVFLLSLHLGPTAMGAAPAGRRRQIRQIVGDLFAWLLGLVLAVVAYIWLQPRLASWLFGHWPVSSTLSPVASFAPNLTFLESLPLLFVLLWFVSALAGLSMQPSPLPLWPRPGTARWTAAGLILLSLAAAVLTLDPPARPSRGAILFHDTGHLDWGRPRFGQYGPHSGGDFGLWPDYLAAYGYEMQIGPLTAENLSEVQAVVLINLPEMLSAGEKERLLRFVQAGGGLIIWGEHTGVGRIRDPINDLLGSLDDTPIHLRFDSAVPIRQGWAEGLALSPHPALYDVRNPVDLVIAVGASLGIQSPARPLIVGRFGHSDMGDASNRARNFVGDMQYNPGEQLGDVVLAAESAVGRGRVVVLGDTTPLGSVNLMTTMPFHARLLDWVTARGPHTWDFLVGNGWLAVTLLVGAAVALVLGRSQLALVGAALSLVAILALTGSLNRIQSSPALPKGPIAYIDVSHQERFDRLLWEATSVGGLNYNLVRNGALPLLLEKVDPAVLSGADLLVIIAPGQPFSAGEVEIVSNWVEEGGRLLISVGFEESEASEALLAAFGLAVEHIPLGPVALERDTGPVRFHEAWPVSATEARAQTIVEGYEFPLAVYQPWGRGGVVVIGDSAFLLGESLEDQYSHQEGNILFLRDILKTYLRLGASP